EEERDDVFRPPVAILDHAVRPAERVRGRRNEKGAEPKAKKDHADVCQRPARFGHNDVRDQRVDDLLHLWIRGQEIFQNVDHLMQLRRVGAERSEEHTSELQSQSNLVCRLLLEKKKKNYTIRPTTYCSKDDEFYRVLSKCI